MFSDRWSNDGQRLSRIGSGIASIRAGAGPIFYVDNVNGNAGYDGRTWATAKATITQGVALANAAGSFSTVYVAGTSYSEPQITVSVDQLKLIAVCNSKQRPLWRNSSPTVGSHLLVMGRQCEIYNFRFHSDSASTKASVILNSLVSDGNAVAYGCVVEDCLFTSAEDAVSSSAIQFLGDGIDHRIINNVFEFFTAGTLWGGAISIHTPDSGTINCTITGNTFIQCVRCLCLQAKLCTITNNNFVGTDYGDNQITTMYMQLLHATSTGSPWQDGSWGDLGSNVIAGNQFPDHFSWEIHSGNGYWFSDTDAVSGNFCKDGIMGRGGPSTAGADAATVQLVPGKTYSMSKTVTDWSAAAQDLFAIAGGPIKVLSIVGTALEDLKNTSMNLSIVAAVTTPSASVNVASAVQCQNNDEGNIYTLNGTFGSTLVTTATGIHAEDGVEFVMPIGTINMTSDAAETEGGSIRWDILFVPLTTGVSVTVQ